MKCSSRLRLQACAALPTFFFSISGPMWRTSLSLSGSLAT